MMLRCLLCEARVRVVGRPYCLSCTDWVSKQLRAYSEKKLASVIRRFIDRDIQTASAPHFRAKVKARRARQSVELQAYDPKAVTSRRCPTCGRKRE